MVTKLTSETSSQMERTNEFFLARQPILNRDQHLFAYELLFRNAGAGPANVTSDLSATASVIAHVSQLGLENVVGASRGFVNLDAAVLMSDIFQFLPREKVVLEILETVRVTDEIVARVAELVKAGYTFALDDVIADSLDVRRLLPLVDIIKVDIMGMPRDDLQKLSKQFHLSNKKLLAEKVENFEEFHYCLGLGFDYFQGYYFAKPVILSGKKLSPSQLVILQLMEQLVSDADSTDIEHTIKRDVSLGFNLLRLVNTPAAGVLHRIDSLGQALIVLGRRQLQRWLQILLYAEPDKAGHSMSPLMTLATTRGKLLELMMGKMKPGNRNMADIAFTVGIMSLMDTLFGMPMEKILEQIAVVDEVSEALLHRQGVYGEMLKLAEYIDHIEENGALLGPTLDALQLSSEDLGEMQLAAFEWSNQIASSAS